MDKQAILNKISSLLDDGYTFIALDNGFDEVCINKAIVSALRSVPLNAYYNPTMLKGKINLAHTNIKTELRRDNSIVFNDNLTIVKSPESDLILAPESDNAKIGLYQDYIDFTNQTGIVLKSAGNWRQERGSGELINRINRQSK